MNIFKVYENENQLLKNQGYIPERNEPLGGRENAVAKEGLYSNCHYLILYVYQLTEAQGRRGGGYE